MPAAERSGIGAAALERPVERLEILDPRQRELAPYPLMRRIRAAILGLGYKFLNGVALIAGVLQFRLQLRHFCLRFRPLRLRRRRCALALGLAPLAGGGAQAFVLR